MKNFVSDSENWFVARGLEIVPRSARAEPNDNNCKASAAHLLGNGRAEMSSRKLIGVCIVVLTGFVTQPAWAQRGGGPGGGGGGCSGQSSASQTSAMASTPYTQNALSPYTQNPMAQQYALQQMQQQYMQQAMAMRQMMAQMQMENQRLQTQLAQLQNQERVAAKDANGDSNQLLTATKKSKASATKSKSASRSRTAAQRAADKSDEQRLALK